MTETTRRLFDEERRIKVFRGADGILAIAPARHISLVTLPACGRNTEERRPCTGAVEQDPCLQWPQQGQRRHCSLQLWN